MSHPTGIDELDCVSPGCRRGVRVVVALFRSLGAWNNGADGRDGFAGTAPVLADFRFR